MGKVIIFFILFISSLFAQKPTPMLPKELDRACLQCHQREQIPSSLVYRRYLMRYSTPERISNAMLAYLKHPSKANSIMPSQFFLKFPMKEKSLMKENVLKRYIYYYIEAFDVKKRLVLP